MFLTDEPDNTEQHRMVFRSKSYYRRRVDNIRFNSPIHTDFNEFRDFDPNEGKPGEENTKANWLGRTWWYKHNKVYPSLLQIESGLIAEAMEQLRLSMLNVKSSQAHIDAKNNISKTWRNLLQKASVPDRNQPLTYKILHDP